MTSRIAQRAGVLLVMGAALGASACTKAENVLAGIPVFSMLRNAPFFDPYEAPRPAPPNAVAFMSPAGDTPGPMLNTEVGLTAFGAGYANPLAAGDSLALAVGQDRYLRHCSVCHGPQGKGDGPIINKPGETGKFPYAPNLALPISVARTDGYLYAIIAAGRGLMPAYGPRMNEAERWATVIYLRQLQRQSGATPAVTPAAPAAAPAAGPGR